MTDPVARAARALREQYDGRSPEAPVEWNRIERRVLASRRVPTIRTMALGVLGATLIGSTVWATGLSWIRPTRHGATARATAAAHSSPTRPLESPPEPTIGHEASDKVRVTDVTTGEMHSSGRSVQTSPYDPTPVHKPQRAVTVKRVEPEAAQVRTNPATAVQPAVTKEPAEPARDENLALYAEAHRRHFRDNDARVALDAWERYLRHAPTDRFVPEAEYNRALALVRLGRVAEAERVLRAFARGRWGDYRREEAARLLSAIARSSRGGRAETASE